jgi:hypothetical protein
VKGTFKIDDIGREPRGTGRLGLDEIPEFKGRPDEAAEE